jgi:ATP-dependent DNA helicase RecG
MALPVNIEDLIHGKAVEWDRLEFKRGWNPEEIAHTICAFANDLNNWGGGYIIVGIEEDNGQPILPPEGLEQNQLDRIQGEVLELAHQMLPNYFPIFQPYLFQDKYIFVMWCPAGDHRPYTALSTQGRKAQRQPYIRYGSRSIIARGDNLNRLNELAARIPFDDRVNQQATINDLDLGLIRSYLQEIKSDLFEESLEMKFPDLCRTMHIAKGPKENLLPVNVGLLFFSKKPENFFSRAWIELVWHKDGSGKKFQEFFFKGPLHKQLEDTLSFLKSNIIGEQVIKYSDRAKADRFYNFPYDAVEEVLSNAVYHKSYEIGSPIEVQVWPDKIEVLSFPGPVPPVDAKILSTQKRIVSRESRNRRIGDFLKELEYTEGRGTGFPTIYNAMANNASPEPIFETNEDSTHVLATLPVHELALNNDEVSNIVTNQVNDNVFNTLEEIVTFCNDDSNGVSNGANERIREIIKDNINDRVGEVLEVLNKMTKRAELFEKVGLSNQSKNRKKYLDPLIELGWIRKEFPDTVTNPKQRYVTTESGKRLLKLLINNRRK